MISKYRPKAPIVVVTRNPQTARQVHLYRGCFPFYYNKPSSSSATHSSNNHLTVSAAHLNSPADHAPWQEDVDARLIYGMEQAMKYGMLKHGQACVAVQGWKVSINDTTCISPKDTNEHCILGWPWQYQYLACYLCSIVIRNTFQNKAKSHVGLFN